MFQPLISSLYDCIHSAYRLTHQVPKYCEFSLTNETRIGNSLSIGIGRSRSNEVYLNINQSSPHTYIVGNTGSGKSNLLKVILSTIINNYKNVRLVLCDYKRCELSMFAKCNNVISFSYDDETISNTINNLYQTVLDKYDKLMKENRYQCSTYDETILLVIEEISLMDKKTMKILRKLMAISRAVNVYTIFTCQRPSNECIDNVVKSLVTNRIVLRTEDKKNSIIALDEEGAENLKGNGHGIIKNSEFKCEFQAYYLKDDVLNEIVKANSKTSIENINVKPKNINPKINDDSWIYKL